MSESDRKLLAAAANPLGISSLDATGAATVLNYLNGGSVDDGILRRSVKGVCATAPEADFQFGTVGQHFGSLL